MEAREGPEPQCANGTPRPWIKGFSPIGCILGDSSVNCQDFSRKKEPDALIGRSPFFSVGRWVAKTVSPNDLPVFPLPATGGLFLRFFPYSGGLPCSSMLPNPCLPGAASTIAPRS